VNGRFELTGVAVGAATVRAERPGYAPEEVAVTLTAGLNSRDFALTPQEVYQVGVNAVFVPADVERIRGAIVILGGPNTTGFVTGERITPTTFAPEIEEAQQQLATSLRELARTEGVALLGSSTTGMDNSAASDDALFAGLATAGVRSGHPELADLPVLTLGISGGSPEASGLASRHPERTVGVLVRIPPDVSALTAQQALAVPTFVMQAAEDQVVSNFPVRTKFLENRSRGGLWALAVEPGIGHYIATQRGNSAQLTWIRIALERRLPATAGDPLVSLEETSGWLGNQSTLEIAPWADYPDTRSAASWLLSQQAAASWKSLGTASGGT
jgi:hypothetical protein